MGREGEREGAKHQCVRDTSYVFQPGTWSATQACALAGS